MAASPATLYPGGVTPSATGAKPDDGVNTVDGGISAPAGAGSPEPRTAVDGELLAPEEAYDDAAVMALDYPLVRLRHRSTVDRLAKETRWQEICEEISTHGALERPYLD